MTTTTPTGTNVHAKVLAALMTLGADIDGALHRVSVSFREYGSVHVCLHEAPVNVVLTLLGLTGLTEAVAVPKRRDGTEWVAINWCGDIEVVGFVNDADAAHAELLSALVRDALIPAAADPCASTTSSPTVPSAPTCPWC